MCSWKQITFILTYIDIVSKLNLGGYVINEYTYISGITMNTYVISYRKLPNIQAYR